MNYNNLEKNEYYIGFNGAARTFLDETALPPPPKEVIYELFIDRRR